MMRDLLEKQIEQDRDRRLRSREERRSNPGGQMTFGPKETDDTVQYQILKKHSDINEVRNGLQK